jgi:ubiquinone biosynthesis O-methyltransferase
MANTTVNSTEVDKFAKLSAQWWDPKRNGGLKILHAMNSIRIPLIESTIDLKKPGRKRILDIGCGGGYLSEGLATRFHSLGLTDQEIEIIGMDPAEDSIAVAKAHLPPQLRNMCSYVCDSIENYVESHPFTLFDTVVMSEVIEHVDNPEEFLRMAVGVVKPGGSVIITTPGKSFFGWLSLIVCAEYIFRVLPVGTHEYKKLISISDCERMLRENACAIKDVKGMCYNPITKIFSWNDLCKIVAYAVHAVKLDEA